MSFSNEEHLEQTFVDNLDQLTPSLTGTKVPCLVIGRQIRLLAHDIPDLLVLDAVGRLYVVEAKLSRNPEISGPVFQQLSRYLAVLNQISFDDLAAYLVSGFRKHIQLPFPHRLPKQGWQKLDEILEAWQLHTGIKKPSSNELVASLAHRVKQRRIVPVVLTDGIPLGWNAPEKLDGTSEALQVLAIHDDGKVLKHIGLCPSSWKQITGERIKLTAYQDWIRQRTAPARTLEDFRSKLFPPSYQLIETIIRPWVKKTGFRIVPKGNAKSLSIYYQDQEILAIGPSDDDSKKQREEFGYDPLRVLKVNPIFRRISPLEDGINHLTAEQRRHLDQLWRRLQLECGFRRRGDKSTLLPGDPGFKPFQISDYPSAPKWHGEFKRQYRTPDGTVRQDFYDESDAKALKLTLNIIAELVREIYGQG